MSADEIPNMVTQFGLAGFGIFLAYRVLLRYLDNVCKKYDLLIIKVDDMSEKINSVAERVSKLEGKHE